MTKKDLYYVNRWCSDWFKENTKAPTYKHIYETIHNSAYYAPGVISAIYKRCVKRETIIHPWSATIIYNYIPVASEYTVR